MCIHIYIYIYIYYIYHHISIKTLGLPYSPFSIYIFYLSIYLYIYSVCNMYSVSIIWVGVKIKDLQNPRWLSPFWELTIGYPIFDPHILIWNGGWYAKIIHFWLVGSIINHPFCIFWGFSILGNTTYMPTNIAIEHGHLVRRFTYQKWWLFHRYGISFSWLYHIPLYSHYCMSH